jgi:hypothetical protein
VAVFGGILAVFLYFYLLRNEGETQTKVKDVGKVEDEKFEDEVAKHLDSLFEQVDVLEEKINAVYDYVKRESEETRKKK